MLLAGYLREATTPIGRGENSGRTLKESNIDPWLHDLGRWNGKPREFEISGSRLPENVTDIAVLVSPPVKARSVTRWHNRFGDGQARRKLNFEAAAAQ